MIEATVARCSVCGTQYTARAWYWLEPVGRSGDARDRRSCAVPGCCHVLERQKDVALRLATCLPDNDSRGDGRSEIVVNDTCQEEGEE